MTITRTIEVPLKAVPQFIEDRIAAGRVAFSLDELVETTGLSKSAARQRLLRLRHAVLRPTRVHQFFLIVTPEHRAIGAPPAAWWLDDYFKWLGHPYYLALQSAAGTHGSAPQGIQVTQVMTDRPRREIIVGRLRVHFFVKRAIARTPTQQPAISQAPLTVSTPEATAFDLVRYASRIGGLERAIETFTPFLAKLRVSELRRVLDAEQEVSTAQRLGYILERKGRGKLAEVVHDWLPSVLPLIPLVPAAQKPRDASVIKKWKLLTTAGDSGL